jgi:hypothetical protein
MKWAMGQIQKRAFWYSDMFGCFWKNTELGARMNKWPPFSHLKRCLQIDLGSRGTCMHAPSFKCI